MGLVFLGFINDPIGKHSESHGVAADPTTTLRDSATFRWLALIVDIMQSFKVTLPKYTASILGFPGVKFKSLLVASEEAKNVVKKNEFLTCFGYQDCDLSWGLDYTPRETILARYRQLQCKPFNYQLNLNSNTKKQVTIRIFLLPKYDERNAELTFSEQRKMAIELDKFWVTRE